MPRWFRPQAGSRVGIDRRRFLYATGGFAGLALINPFKDAIEVAAQTFPNNPFTLGVASGDPLGDRVVLWTRLAPSPLAADGAGGMDPVRVPVEWRVATDDAMQNVVRSGTAYAEPEFAHSVHIDVDGLQPAQWYWYQFQAGSEYSPIGRTRTGVPRLTPMSRLKFGVVSCQHYEMGFFTAHGHMAAEDLDLVLHLGDYIYEDGRSPTLPRQHNVGEPMTLGAYRIRHALYKTDPHLQAAHAAFPWMVVFDDHEVENNWASRFDENGNPPDAFLPRRAQAFQAYYEHMPLRAAQLPKGPDIQLYRRIQFGDLALLNMLDTRQFRDDQACGDGTDIGCAEALDPNRTILGAAQERWLKTNLAVSPTTWNVLGQQVFFAQRDFEAGALKRLSMDSWDGYAPTRDRLLNTVIGANVRNLVVLTGDVHANYACEIKANFDDPTSATIGSEFVATSITSGGNGVDVPTNAGLLYAENPHIKFVNTQRGYVVCDLTHERYQATYRVVPFVTTQGAPVTTRASFVVENGVPGVNPA